jgi:hypothetical protein
MGCQSPAIKAGRQLRLLRLTTVSAVRNRRAIFVLLFGVIVMDSAQRLF